MTLPAAAAAAASPAAIASAIAGGANAIFGGIKLGLDIFDRAKKEPRHVIVNIRNDTTYAFWPRSVQCGEKQVSSLRVCCVCVCCVCLCGGTHNSQELCQ